MKVLLILGFLFAGSTAIEAETRCKTKWNEIMRRSETVCEESYGSSGYSDSYQPPKRTICKTKWNEIMQRSETVCEEE